MTFLLVHKNKAVREQYILQLLRDRGVASAQSIEQLSNNPDIHIIDPASKNIGIDEMKELQLTMMYKPFGQSEQYGIILDAQRMTAEAQNSMLKTFEESSTYSHYILTTHNERALLETIRSRASTVYIAGESTDGNEETMLNIINLPLVEQFIQIETLDQDQKEDRSILTQFLQDLVQDVRNSSIPAQSRHEIFERIVETQRRTQSNINVRLALEHLILYIKQRNS